MNGPPDKALDTSMIESLVSNGVTVSENSQVVVVGKSRQVIVRRSWPSMIDVDYNKWNNESAKIYSGTSLPVYMPNLASSVELSKSHLVLQLGRDSAPLIQAATIG